MHNHQNELMQEAIAINIKLVSKGLHLIHENSLPKINTAEYKEPNLPHSGHKSSRLLANKETKLHLRRTNHTATTVQFCSSNEPTHAALERSQRGMTAASGRGKGT
jgi:hypothetical protein